MVEVAMAFAESVVQKMVFLSSDVQTFLVDAFCERVATKAFAEMERPAIEMVVDLPARFVPPRPDRASIAET